MITREEVRHLAELARLDLPATEEESLSRDLSAVLDYVGRLGQAPIEAESKNDLAEPALGEESAWRTDEPEGSRLSGEREELLNAAPDRAGDYFRVKKVL